MTVPTFFNRNTDSLQSTPPYSFLHASFSCCLSRLFDLCARSIQLHPRVSNAWASPTASLMPLRQPALFLELTEAKISPSIMKWKILRLSELEVTLEVIFQMQIRERTCLAC